LKSPEPENVAASWVKKFGWSKKLQFSNKIFPKWWIFSPTFSILTENFPSTEIYEMGQILPPTVMPVQ